MKFNWMVLMPNHFHLFVLVNEVSLPLDALTEGLASSETLGCQCKAYKIYCINI